MKEQREIDLLLNKGFEIETQLFGKKKIWRTKMMSIGRLIQLSNLFIKMDVDEDNLNSENIQIQIAEQYAMVRNNAELCAEVMAISVSDNVIMRWWLKRHFLKNITAAKLRDFTMDLLKHSDYKNFMTSTILMNGNRPTKAAMVEQRG